MNTSELGFEILSHDCSPTKLIERVARICYKSEDKIADGTDKEMVRRLHKNRHNAMLEHYRFIMEIPSDIYQIIEVVDHNYINMTHCEYDGVSRCLISASARGISELPDTCHATHHGILPSVINTIVDSLILHIIKKYDCAVLFGEEYEGIDTDPVFDVKFIENTCSAMSAQERNMHGWMCVVFHVDRGISHELVRHRPASFAQESTRYCNYGNTGLNVIRPSGIYNEAVDEWVDAMMDAEKHYNRLVKNFGVAPQDARSVLPHATKVDMAVTTYLLEWRHIFALRALGVTGKPHPMMAQVMSQLYEEYKKIWEI